MIYLNNTKWFFCVVWITPATNQRALPPLDWKPARVSKTESKEQQNVLGHHLQDSKMENPTDVVVGQHQLQTEHNQESNTKISKPVV